jgi:hypothetical protein
VTPAKTGTVPSARLTIFDGHQAAPNLTTAFVSFPTEEFGTGGLHSVTTRRTRLTAPIAGKYLVFGEIT